MQYSTNNHLKLMEGTDNVRRQDFVDNFNTIDDGLSKLWVPAIDLKLSDVLFEADSDEDAKLYFYAREKL